MRVAFVTFGCRLNHAEALDMEARFLADGHRVVTLKEIEGPGEKADTIIVRCCSVTAKAQHDCEKEIARLRRQHPDAQIVATGCLPNAINGLDAIDLTEKPQGTVPTCPVPLATSRAYIKIQDGCSGRCSFCIVPQFRGSPVSVPYDSVLERARAFLEAGFRELVVTGCNLALYHDGGHDIADLLAALAELPPPSNSKGELQTSPNAIHRIRIGSLEPGFHEERLLDVFSGHANICRFIHLSLQSASDRILRLMNRPYTAGSVEAFCRLARKRLGNRCMFGADLIAGFPGETDADHAETAGFLQMETDGVPVFCNLHVFPYSERPGTPAAEFPDSIPVTTRRNRANELEEAGRRNRAVFAQKLIGHDVVVCIEKDGKGWTDEYMRMDTPTNAPRRSLQHLHVSEVTSGGLLVQRPDQSQTERSCAMASSGLCG